MLQPPSARPASSATSSVCASAQTKGLHIPSTCASHLHYNGAAGPPTACQQPETVTIPASASPRTPLAQLAPRVRPACPTAHRRPDGAENERAIAHRAAEPAEACSRHDHARRRLPTATMQSPPRRSRVGHLLVAEPCRANAKPALHREDRPLRALPQDCHRVILPCQTVPIVVQNPPRVAPISDCVNHPHTLCSPCMSLEHLQRCPPSQPASCEASRSEQQRQQEVWIGQNGGPARLERLRGRRTEARQAGRESGRPGVGRRP